PLDGRRLPRWVSVQVVAELARIRLAAGAPDAALRLLDEAGDAPWAVLLRATAAVLTGDEGAIALPGEGDDLPPVLLVEAQILRACRNLQAGAGQSAVDALHGALRSARGEALRRPFFDSPAQVRRLLRTQPQLTHSAAWLNPSSGATPERRSGAPAAAPAERVPEVLQALSERELEVLRHLAELLSTAEIAAAMFVSVNTVRTHIRSILRKLSVSRRNQAVRRSRELGLL
ncbi:MAG: response regulator transcription factor, partial [Kineosporiaceae bacterium]